MDRLSTQKFCSHQVQVVLKSRTGMQAASSENLFGEYSSIGKTCHSS